MIAARDGLATIDAPAPAPWQPASRWALFLSRFRRRRGPLVRYWSAELEFLGLDPVKVEAWGAWARRQALRPLVAAHRARWFA